MEQVLLVVHLIIAIALIGVVLLQRSEGGALGIGGGGGSGNLFTARGVGNALTRTTAYLAVGFFITSIGLTILATHRSGGSIIDGVTPPAQNGAAPAPAQGGSGVKLPDLGTGTAPAPAQQPPANP